MSDKKYPHLLVETDPETGDILISPARAWVKNPITGQKETIKDSWVPKKPIRCPTCKAEGLWKMTLTEEHIVISCGACGMHTWCKDKEA